VQRALAIPVTGAAAGAAPLTGATLLGAGAFILAGSLRRRPAPRRRPFDDDLPAHW
jgi:hypothetical protein